MDKRKILVAEDDGFISEMYYVKLSASNFEVIIASDGKEAFKKFKENKPGVVLLDIMMPELNGWEVLEKIREEDSEKKVVVIMLTNLGDKKNIDKALSAGADDYLIKSFFTPEEVVRKVEDLLKTK